MLHIFDLDGTLVHTHRELYSGCVSFPLYLCGDEHNVHIRPHVLSLLRFMHHRKIPWGVWTAGSKMYMSQVVIELCKRADIPASSAKLCLSRDHTSRSQGAHIKDLSFFGGIDIVLYDNDVTHKNWPGNKGRNIVVVPEYNVTCSSSAIDCYFLSLRCELAAGML